MESGFAEYMEGEHGEPGVWEETAEMEGWEDPTPCSPGDEWRQGMEGVWAANLPCLKLQVVLSAPQIGIKLLSCVRRVRRKAGREEPLSFPR